MAGICKAKSRRAAKHEKSRKYLKNFLTAIKRKGRWRGHKFTDTDQLMGLTLDVRPARKSSHY